MESPNWSQVELKDVAAEVLVLDDVGKLFETYAASILTFFFFKSGRFKRQLVENFLQNGVQPARADMFRSARSRWWQTAL